MIPVLILTVRDSYSMGLFVHICLVLSGVADRSKSEVPRGQTGLNSFVDFQFQSPFHGGTLFVTSLSSPDFVLKYILVCNINFITSLPYNSSRFCLVFLCIFVICHTLF